MSLKKYYLVSKAVNSKKNCEKDLVAMNLADGLDDDGDSSQVFVEISVHRQVRESNQQLSMKPEGMEEQHQHQSRDQYLACALPESFKRSQTDVV